MKKQISRRTFVGGAAAAAAVAKPLVTARSYTRIVGANDRINIGFLGCGARSRGHRRMVEMSFKDKNLGVVAVCDLWSVNRTRAAEDCKKKFNADVNQFQYSEEMLAMPELDAVMIATGDHQHGILIRFRAWPHTMIQDFSIHFLRATPTGSVTTTASEEKKPLFMVRAVKALRAGS